MPRKPRPTHLIDLKNTEELEFENTLYYNVFNVVTWDNSKATANQKKHGVSFDEAATVLFVSPSIVIEDFRHDEQRFIIIGYSTTARLLTVVYVYRYEDEIRIISARRATKNEVKKYEERI